MGDYIQQFAAKFGVHDMIRTTRMPNTRRALAMAEFARDQDKLDTFRTLAMDAHWKEGKDIEDSDILKELAAASGLNSEKALIATSDPVYLDRIASTRVEFKSLGVGGIPTFVFGDEIVEGCAPYETLTEIALHAGVKPRMTAL